MADCSPSDDCINTEGSFECLPRCAQGFRRSTTDSLHCVGLYTYMFHLSLIAYHVRGPLFIVVQVLLEIQFFLLVCDCELCI